MNRRARTIDPGSLSTGIGKWIVPALLISLLLHWAIWMLCHQVLINPLRGVDYDPTPPRRFQLDSVDLDPRLLNPAPAEVQRPAAAPVAVKLPDENVALEKSGGQNPALPPMPKLDSAILAETPDVLMPTLQNTLKTLEAKDAAFPKSDLLTEALLSEKPVVSGTSALALPKPGWKSGAKESGGEGTGRGFSNLDDLLAQTGPLTPETAPILMPTDLLFDYDAPNLRDQAVASLQKLGVLIQRNPGARFVIEGHSDSFGSEEYNLELSRRRADSVKAWLTGVMGLPDSAIRTVGFGKSRLIAPATGTIEEQQINRRVEIVIQSASQP